MDAYPVSARRPPRGPPPEPRLQPRGGLPGTAPGRDCTPVRVQTIRAAVETAEILWELRDHAAGLNLGRVAREPSARVSGSRPHQAERRRDEVRAGGSCSTCGSRAGGSPRPASRTTRAWPSGPWPRGPGGGAGRPSTWWRTRRRRRSAAPRPGRGHHGATRREGSRATRELCRAIECRGRRRSGRRRAPPPRARRARRSRRRPRGVDAAGGEAHRPLVHGPADLGPHRPQPGGARSCRRSAARGGRIARSAAHGARFPSGAIRRPRARTGPEARGRASAWRRPGQPRRAAGPRS